MEVIRAKVMGYCIGVRKAVETAYNELNNKRTNTVYTLGPLIHNPYILEKLKDKGAKTLFDEKNIPENLQDSVVIIRAHGITPSLEKELKDKGAHIIDATCSHVKANQLKAETLLKSGYEIFLAGDKDHAELIGIQGYAPNCLIVSNPITAEERAEKLYHENPERKLALIGQTTISASEYILIGKAIQKYFPNLEIVNSICNATRDRQNALKDLCTQVEALIIMGGKESANTQRLFSIAQSQGKRSWLIETADDIPKEVFSYSKIGLCAGASTPDELIDKIEEVLLKE